MLPASRTTLLESLTPGDKVLDIGGWADPFERANWVMDVMPYESRGLYERSGWADDAERGPERFSEATWIQRDICSREPYPFGDGELDFVICSHTLEDIRDPIWVCSEMSRIAKAGYVETPSMLEELSYGFQGPLAGWPHHRWLIEVDQQHIRFIFKDHTLHHRAETHFPRGFRKLLSDEERVETLWWQGELSCEERHFVGISPADQYVQEFVQSELSKRSLQPANRIGDRPRIRRWLHRPSRRRLFRRRA